MSAGFSFFPGDALRWSRQRRDFTSRIQMRRCRQLQVQEFAAAKCEAMSDTASQRQQKLYRIKPVERNFFSIYFFALTESQGALLSLSGCDNLLGSDPPYSRPKFVSRNVQNKQHAQPPGCRGSDAMKSTFNRSVLALAAIFVVAGAGQAAAQDKPLKKYESGTKEFWTHPPDHWFLGDETEAQKGLAPPSGPPTGASEAELAAMMKKIKLPPGFQIEVYAPGVLQARQMAWGDKGTLFVGSFDLGNVYAITDTGGKKEVKTVLKKLNMPTGLAFKDGALYVIAIDKLMKYDNAEANLDKLGDGKVVYDDMPSYVAHGWKYLAPDKDGWFYVPF